MNKDDYLKDDNLEIKSENDRTKEVDNREVASTQEVDNNETSSEENITQEVDSNETEQDTLEINTPKLEENETPNDIYSNSNNQAEGVPSCFQNETISSFNSQNSSYSQPYIQDYSNYKHTTQDPNSFNHAKQNEYNNMYSHHYTPNSHSYNEFQPPRPQYQNQSAPNYNQPNYSNQGYTQNNSQPNYNNQNYYQNNSQPINNGQNPYNPSNFQNNNEPYYPPYQPVQPNAPKKKMRTSIKVLIASIITLFVICIGVVAVITAMSLANNLFKFNSDFLDDIMPTLPGQTEPNSSIIVPDDEPSPYIDPDSTGIELIEQPSDISDTTKYSASYAFEKCSPSIVAVITLEGEDQISEGTGVIISEDGYIISNSHVINDSNKYNIMIAFNSKTYEASVVGYDVRTDLAVLKISTDEILTPAVFASPDSLKIGQEVVAIGNPGGVQFSKSITKGIISALDRQMDDGGNVSYIQTDAAINPGNSGGPLVNLNGEVIGINTIKIVDTEYEGMGFAIPSDTVEEITDDLIKNGKVEGRTRLGITVFEINEYVSEMYDIPTGVQIESFDSDSTLEDDGAKAEDVITHINGEEVTSISQLYAQLEKYLPGDEVELTLYNIETEKSYKITTKLLEAD